MPGECVATPGPDPAATEGRAYAGRRESESEALGMAHHHRGGRQGLRSGTVRCPAGLSGGLAAAGRRPSHGRQGHGCGSSRLLLPSQSLQHRREGFRRPLVCSEGQRCLDGRRGWGVVPEVFLHAAPIDAGVAALGRPGMAPGMNAGQLVDAARLEGFPAGFRKAALGHGLRCGGSVASSSTRSRKQQPGLARGDPAVAPECQGPLGPWDVPGFPAFPVAAMKAQARALASGHSKRGALLQPQPAGVHGGETGAGREQPDVPEELSPRLEAQDDGEFPLPRWAHASPGRPCSLEGLRNDKLDPAQGNGGRTAGVLPDVLPGKEGLAQFCLRDLLRGFVHVWRKVAPGPHVPLVRTFRQAPELESLAHSSAAFCHG